MKGARLAHAAVCVAVAGLTGCALPQGPFRGQSATAWIDAETPAVEPWDLPIQGVALGLHFEHPGRSYESYLWEIARSGASHVSLVVQWSMADIRAVEVARHPTLSPSDEDIVRAMEAARALGLEVTLFPILWIEERAAGEWRGRLAPSDPALWFDQYEAYIVHMAELAARAGAESFSIGSELGSMEVYETRWVRLAERVRTVYPGRLLYSANWDHYNETPFWHAVDLIGVTGYHELTRSDDEVPSIDAMVAAWEPIVTDLQQLAEREDRAVVFTEIGYVAQSSAPRRPWDYTASGDVDLRTQFNAYAALHQAWRAHPSLDGLYIWNWFGDGGSEDNGYTPRNKPAEWLLERWYGAPTSGAP